MTTNAPILIAGGGIGGLATALAIPRVNGFVLTALRLGRVAQWENGLARAVRDQLFAWMPASAMERQLVKSLAFPG